MKNTQKGFTVFELSMIFVIIGLMILMAFLFFNNLTNKQPTKAAVATKTTTPKPSVKATPKPTTPIIKTGTITGKASYPSEGLPADEQVCAQDIGSAAAPICVNVGAQPTNVYSLKVPVGSYYVYSTSAQFPTPGYKAYYDAYVACGMAYNCPVSGHQQNVNVQVGDGKTAYGVDPADWYITQ